MFPAGAGMNRRYRPSEGLIIDVPRRRGDEPGSGAIHFVDIKCSPQARG